MKYTSLIVHVVIVALTQLCHAMPIDKRVDISDTDILNVALSLEHLEDTFYRQFLSQFSPADFTGAGFPSWVRDRYEQIGQHEATHVAFLTNTLNAASVPAVQACTYNFPVQTPQDFVALSVALETVGSSAYSGAAKRLVDKNHVAAGALILAVEARQSTWIQSAVQTHNPWSNNFETPLDLGQAFTLASPFIVSCPDSNPKLPVSAFPALSVPADAKPGQTVKLSFDTSTSGPLYAAFLSGMDVKWVPIGQDLTVQIPGDLLGTTYLIVTKDNTQVTDENTVAGPVILLLFFDSSGILE